MKKKNIAIYIDSLAGGGAERVMIDLAKEIIARGHIVHFFLLESVVDHPLPDSIPVHTINVKGKRSHFTGYFQLNKTAQVMTSLVRSTEQEIGEFDLHLVNLDSSNQVIDRCNFANVYYVIHNSIEQELSRAKKRNPLRYLRTRREKRTLHGKNLIAVSHGVAKEAECSSLFRPASVQTIYNPCDIPNIQQLAAQINLDIPTEPYLIHVGRVVRQKRHDILFQALKLVPDIKLVLLCKNIKKVRRLAEKFGVADRIITPSFQTNPYNWIKQAKLMVFSSDFEGLGMVLIESLICGTPVVSTDCNFGPSEILTGELAEYLAPVGDPLALSEKITLALAHDIDTKGADIISKVALPNIADQYLSLTK